MTIELTEEQVEYLREFVNEKIQYESLEPEEYDMLVDLSEKLDDETQNEDDE